MQTDVLDHSPNDHQATRLYCEHINLISPLPYIAKQALNGISRLNIPMHPLRKVVKREGLLFLLCQTAHCLWIPLATFGFEGRQLGYSLPLAGLIPDANEFSLNISALASRDGIQDIALFLQQTALARRSRKQF
jgi:hypothetical protein